MAIIDYTYFVSDLTIAGIDKEYVREDLQFMIDKFETKLLESIFGVKFTKEFLAGIKEDPMLEKWDRLLNGCYYNDDRLRWMGFRNPEKQSIIANYVYYYYTRKEVTQNTGIGVVATKGENSVRVSPIRKQTDAWNEMCDWIKDLHRFMKFHHADYSDYYYVNYGYPCFFYNCRCQFRCGTTRYPFAKVNVLNL